MYVRYSNNDFREKKIILDKWVNYILDNFAY